MNTGGIIGACLGGALGAFIWAGIAYFAGIEIGLVAWGIGLLVGVLSAKLGGFGPANGGLCALIAVAAIVGGKGLAIKFMIENFVTEAAAEQFEILQQDAEAFAEVGSEADYPEFMVANGYSEAESSDEIGEDELQSFTEDTVPVLQEAVEMSPEAWETSTYANSFREFARSSTSIKSALKEGIGPIDLLFGLMGVATAFKVGSGESDEDDDD